MNPSIRARVKKVFDDIVYQSPFLNKVLRNLNKQLSSLTSFRLRPFGVMTVRLKSGVSFKMATNETSSVTKLLFWNGADRYEYTAVFEPLIKRCRVFIDVGANTGYYSLLASSVNTQIQVFSLEPASAPLHYLRENITINGLESRVKSFELALSDKQGNVEFFEVEDQQNTKPSLAGSGTLLKEDTYIKKFISRWVPSDTLDSFVEKNGISTVDLIKLDTEGTENLILKGADKTLRIHRPIIICETLFNTIERELESIMRSHGYHFFNFKNGKLYKTESIERELDNGVRDCFFVHPEKESLIQEFVEYP